MTTAKQDTITCVALEHNIHTCSSHRVKKKIEKFSPGEKISSYNNYGTYLLEGTEFIYFMPVDPCSCMHTYMSLHI